MTVTDSVQTQQGDYQARSRSQTTEWFPIISATFLFLFLLARQADYQALPRPQTSKVVRTTDEVTVSQFPVISANFFFVNFFLLYFPALPDSLVCVGTHLGSVFVLLYKLCVNPSCVKLFCSPRTCREKKNPRLLGRCLGAFFLTPVEGKKDRWGVSPRTGRGCVPSGETVGTIPSLFPRDDKRARQVNTWSLAGFGWESFAWVRCTGFTDGVLPMGSIPGTAHWWWKIWWGDIFGWVVDFFLGGAGEGKRNSRARAVETFSQDDVSSSFSAACVRQSRTVSPILDTLGRHVRYLRST